MPGVSSGTTLLILKLFKPMINAVNECRRDPRRNLPFLAALFSGTAAGAVLFSNFITLVLYKFPLATSLFFSGLIIGSIPMIYRTANTSRIKKRYFIPCILCFAMIVSISFFKGLGSTKIVVDMSVPTFLWLFAASAVSCAAMVLPGASSAIVMIMFGAYHTSINANANIIHFTDFKSFADAAIILVPIILGMVAGMVLISRLMAYFLHHYHTVTYFSMIGLMLGSVFTLLNNKTIFTSDLPVAEIVISVVLFFVGAVLAYKISNRKSFTESGI